MWHPYFSKHPALPGSVSTEELTLPAFTHCHGQSLLVLAMQDKSERILTAALDIIICSIFFTSLSNVLHLSHRRAILALSTLTQPYTWPSIVVLLSASLGSERIATIKRLTKLCFTSMVSFVIVHDHVQLSSAFNGIHYSMKRSQK